MRTMPRPVGIAAGLAAAAHHMAGPQSWPWNRAALAPRQLAQTRWAQPGNQCGARRCGSQGQCWCEVPSAAQPLLAVAALSAAPRRAAQAWHTRHLGLGAPREPLHLTLRQSAQAHTPDPQLLKCNKELAQYPSRRPALPSNCRRMLRPVKLPRQQPNYPSPSGRCWHPGSSQACIYVRHPSPTWKA